MAVELLSVWKAYQSGQLSRAMILVNSHLVRHNDDGRGWEILGLIQYARGKVGIAVSALERAALFVPLVPAARVCLAHGYGRIGCPELSRDLLLELIDDESVSIPLLLQVAAGLDAVDQPRLAMRACQVAAQRDADHAQVYYDHGYYAARSGFPPHVTESLARKALELDPDNVRFRVGLASMLIRQDRNDEAYEFVREFSNAQIEQINCRCCLERIVQLFEEAHDYRRVVLCRQQLLSLELRGVESDCE